MKVRKYPSINRDLMREAIKVDVRKWTQQTEKDEIDKTMKKMKMLFGHLCMWEEKMKEILATDRPS